MNQAECLALARAILAAAEAREGSYDKAAAEAASADAGPYSLVNYGKFYGLTLRQAAEQAAGLGAEPVYLLLEYTWNDALDWADEQVGRMVG